MPLPFAQLPEDGSSQINWGVVGPWEAPNGNLYQVGSRRSGTTANATIESSTDGGVTWNSISTTKTLAAAYNSVCFAGTKIFVLFWRTFATATNSFVAVFETSTDSWLANITGLPATVLNEGGNQWAYLNTQIGVLSNGNIYIAQGRTTSAINTPGSAVYWSLYNGASWSAFALIPGQDANQSYAVRSIVVTPADNVYIFMSAYPYVQAPGSAPNGVGDLAYSKNLAAPVVIASGALPYVWPTPASYDIGWSEYHSVGSPSYSAGKIAIPFISGAPASTSPTNPPPYYSPSDEISCAILSTVDGSESVSVEQVSTVDIICPNVLSREQALSCAWAPGGDLYVCGVIATSFTAFATTAQNSDAGDIVYWKRTSGVWGSSTFVYSPTTPLVPSGIVPIVFSSGTRLGFMLYQINSTTPFDSSSRLHLFASVDVAPPTVVLAVPMTATARMLPSALATGAADMGCNPTPFIIHKFRFRQRVIGEYIDGTIGEFYESPEFSVAPGRVGELKDFLLDYDISGIGGRMELYSDLPSHQLTLVRTIAIPYYAGTRSVYAFPLENFADVTTEELPAGQLFKVRLYPPPGGILRLHGRAVFRARVIGVYFEGGNGEVFETQDLDLAGGMGIFRNLEITAQTSGAVTVQMFTELPNQDMRQIDSQTINPASTTSRRLPNFLRLPGNCKGELQRFKVSGSANVRILGMKVLGRRLEVNGGAWQWYPIPFEATLDAWIPIQMPVRATPEAFTWVDVPVDTIE